MMDTRRVYSYSKYENGVETYTICASFEIGYWYTDLSGFDHNIIYAC